MKDKKEIDFLDFTPGSMLMGLGFVVVLVMYLRGEFAGLFTSIKGVLEAFGGIGAMLFFAYIIFILGVEIYNALLKKLEFLKYPVFKALGVIAVLTAAAWLMCEFWGPEGWSTVTTTY